MKVKNEDRSFMRGKNLILISEIFKHQSLSYIYRKYTKKIRSALEIVARALQLTQ